MPGDHRQMLVARDLADPDDRDRIRRQNAHSQAPAQARGAIDPASAGSKTKRKVRAAFSRAFALSPLRRWRALASRAAASAVAPSTTSAYSPARQASARRWTISAGQARPSLRGEDRPPSRRRRRRRRGSRDRRRGARSPRPNCGSARRRRPASSRRTHRASLRAPCATKALCVCLPTTASPASGAVSGLKAWPG